MQTNIINGLEKLEFASLLAGGAIDDSSWVTVEDIEADSVSLTSNADTKTSIIPEDKDTAILVLYVPGDPDLFNFALLQMSPENLAKFFNTVYDPATSTILVQTKRKRANLAIRMTSRPQNGVKKILTFGNTSCEPSYKNNIAKNGLLSLAVAASILPYTTSAGDTHHSEQLVNEDGTSINSTPPTVTITGAPAIASTTVAKNAVAVPVEGGSAIESTEWEVVSAVGAGAPAVLTNEDTDTVTCTVTDDCVVVLEVTTTDVNGNTASAQVTITYTIA